MEPRMTNPVMVVPGAMAALQKLSAGARRSGVPATTLYLVEVRASQINGCSVCLDMHTRELRERRRVRPAHLHDRRLA